MLKKEGGREKRKKEEKQIWHDCSKIFLSKACSVPWLVGLSLPSPDTRESLAPHSPPPMGHVIHIEHATGVVRMFASYITAH